MPKHKKKSEKKSEGSESSSASESPTFYKKMQEKLERYIKRYGALNTTNTENNTREEISENPQNLSRSSSFSVINDNENEKDRSDILTGPQNINPIPSTSSAQNPGEIIADNSNSRQQNSGEILADYSNSDQDTDDDLPLGSDASTIRQTNRTMVDDNSSINDPICVICHDWMNNGRLSILLPCCKLTTHKHCLKEWKDKESRPFRFLDNEMVSCPHCRQEFWSTHTKYKALFAELNAPNTEDNRDLTVNIPDDTGFTYAGEKSPRGGGFTYAGEKSPRGGGFADDDSVIIDSEILNANRPSSSRLYQLVDHELRRANDTLARSSEAINRANRVYAPSLPQLETESQSVVMVSHVFRGTPKGRVNYSNNEQNSASNNTTNRTTSTTTTTATSTPATDTSTSPPNNLATSTTRATSRKSNNKSSKRTSTTTTRVTGRGKKNASPKPSSSCSKQNIGTTKTIKEKVNEALTEHQDDSSNEGDMLLYSPDHPSSPTMAQPVDDELLDSPSESDTPTAYKTKHEAAPKKGKKSNKPDASPGAYGAIRKTHNVAIRIRSPEHSNTGSSYRAEQGHRSPQRAASYNPNPRHHESSPEQSTSRAVNKYRMKGEPSKSGGISRVTHRQRSPLRADVNILKRRNNDSNECTNNCCNHNQRPRLEAQERRSEAPRFRNSPQFEKYMETKQRIEIDRQNGLSEMDIIKKVFKWNLSSQNSPAGHIPERFESCRYFNFGICSNDVTLKDNIPGCLSGQRQVWRVHGCNWCRAHIHVISYHMEEHCILKQMMG